MPSLSPESVAAEPTHAQRRSRRVGSRRETRSAVLLAALLAAAWPPGVARSSRLTVPDDVPTVQAALDAAVDTVLIRGGHYPETPLVLADVDLFGVPGDPAFGRPVLEGLRFYLYSIPPPEIVVRGLEITTPASFVNDGVIGGQITLEDCWLRGGTTTYSEAGGLNLALRRSKLEGNVGLYSHGAYVVDSCEVSGTLHAQGTDTDLVVTNCSFRGSRDRYPIITSPSEIMAAKISGNVVEGYGGGFFVWAEGAVLIEDNLIRDCSSGGIGFRAAAARILRNRVERCGGDGLSGEGSSTLEVAGNTIARCTGSGMRLVLSSGGTIAENLVWGCGGDGIAIWEGYGDATIRNNTMALNDGTGLRTGGAFLDYYRNELTGNISYANRGHGIDWGFGPPTSLGFNNWFGNTLGDVQGMSPSAEDLSTGPGFCDAANGDFRLSADSPLADVPGYGRVGALGVGCGAASRLLAVGPNPTRGPVRIEFFLNGPASIELDLFDVQGRLVASAARGHFPPGRHGVDWPGPGGSSRLPGGLYFLRYRHPGGEDLRRVVLTP